MRTLTFSLALAASAAAFAQDRTQPQVPQAPDAQQRPEVPYVPSAYNECLLTVGTKSWEVLGLTEEQIARVTDLQLRYKQGAKDAEAKAQADAKASAKLNTERKPAKAAAATAAGKANAEQQATKRAAPADGTATALPADTARPTMPEQPMTAQDKMAPATDPKTTDVPADAVNTLTDVPTVSASPYDDELRSILTPEQMKQWERRCDTRTGMVR